MVLEPLIQDPWSLEVDGIFVPLCGKSLNDKVHTIAADNLGAQ